MDKTVPCMKYENNRKNKEIRLAIWFDTLLGEQIDCVHVDGLVDFV